MKRSLALAVLCAALGGPVTLAASHPLHEETGGAGVQQGDIHAPLQVSDTLSLAAVIDAAVARHHDLGVVAATGHYAEAWREQSRSLISGAPLLSQRYQSDRAQDDNGLTEFESGLHLPLWQPGERRNAGQLGEAMATDSLAAAGALRWQLAGELRALLWNLAKARKQLDVAEASLTQSRELERAIQRQVQLGDLPRTHAALARLEVLDAQGAVTRARAELVDLQVEYRVLTGMDQIPGTINETPAEAPAATHPLLEAAQAALARAEHQARAEIYQARGAPSLTIGPRWEQANRDELDAASLGVTVTVPLGVGRAARLAEAAAALTVAAAQRELDQQRRMQHLALHEAEHRLAVARTTADETQAAATLAEDNETAMQKAFAAGEVELVEYLRARRLARDYRLAAALADLEVQQAIALQNQALGVTP